MQNIIRKLEEFPNLIIVGSHAREESKPRDIDIVTSESFDEIEKTFIPLFRNVQKKRNGQLYRKYLINNIEVDIWRTDPSNLQYYVGYRTLTKGHLISLKRIARSKGYLLSNTGLIDNKNKRKTKDWKKILRILEVESGNIRGLFYDV
jgi:DNA polymerase/3'-5' exonuclease PolX